MTNDAWTEESVTSICANLHSISTSIEPDSDSTWLESVLRRNKETVAVTSVVVAILTFLLAVYLWRDGAYQSQQKKLEEDNKAQTARIEKDLQKQHDETLAQEKRRYDARIADLQTSMNRINAIRILSEFANNEHLRSVSDANAARKDFNLPRYKALTALIDVLMNPESSEDGLKFQREQNKSSEESVSADKIPDATELDKAGKRKQLSDVGQYLCRILFAKCHAEDPTVAAVAIAAIGHIINDRNLSPVVEELPAFQDEFFNAFENAKMNNVTYRHLKPNLSGFHLQNTDFSACEFSEGAHFDYAFIRGTKFGNSQLTNVSFKDANGKPDKPQTLPTDFNTTVCVDCDFSDADIPGAVFAGSTLINCTFKGVKQPCDFTAAQFTGLLGQSVLSFNNFTLVKAAFGNTEDIPASFTNCILDDASLIDANYKQPTFISGSANRARFGISSLGHEGAAAAPIRPIFDGISLVGADLGRCDFLSYDEMNNGVCIDNARISSASPLRNTLEEITLEDLQKDRKLEVGNHGWIVVVERTNKELGEAVKYRLVGYLIRVGSEDTSVGAFSLEQDPAKLLLAIRKAAASPNQKELFPSIREGDKEIQLTNMEISDKVHDKGNDPEKESYKLTDDMLKAEILKRWNIDLDAKPESQ